MYGKSSPESTDLIDGPKKTELLRCEDISLLLITLLKLVTVF